MLFRAKKSNLKEESLPSIETLPKRQKDLDDKNHAYSVDETASAVYCQEYKKTSRKDYPNNDAKDEEFVLETSYFDYII